MISTFTKKFVTNTSSTIWSVRIKLDTQARIPLSSFTQKASSYQSYHCIGKGVMPGSENVGNKPVMQCLE
jgi:hypothetical protein